MGSSISKIGGMNSFRGGLNSFRGRSPSQKQPASGIVRMQSFGGEALAGIGTQSRANSFFLGRRKEKLGQHHEGRRPISFRGRINALTALGTPREGGADTEEVRVQSMGGEALMAIVGRGAVGDSVDETPRIPAQPFQEDNGEQQESQATEDELANLAQANTAYTGNAELVDETPRAAAAATTTDMDQL